MFKVQHQPTIKELQQLVDNISTDYYRDLELAKEYRGDIQEDEYNYHARGRLEVLVSLEKLLAPEKGY